MPSVANVCCGGSTAVAPRGEGSSLAVVTIQRDQLTRLMVQVGSCFRKEIAVIRPRDVATTHKKWVEQAMKDEL